MTRRRWLGVIGVIGVIGVFAVGACGADGARMSDAARDELQPRVVEIRALADARQAEQVKLKLEELRFTVNDLFQRDELTEQGADDVLSAADRIEAQLGLITTTTQAPPPPSDRGDDEDRDEDDEDEEDD